MKKLIYILSIISVLFACTKEVVIDIPGFEEQIVLDGRIDTGQPPFLLISKSKDIYAQTDLTAFLNSFVTGAQVTVSNGTTTVQLIEVCTDNLPPGSEPFVAELLGIPVADLATVSICGYTSLDPLIFGEVGKSYDLTVSFEGETYTATTKIEVPVSLDAVYWKPDGNLTNYGFSWATLSDPPGQYDAYMWESKRINTDANGDPLDASFLRPFGSVFDDEFFGGLTFDFFFDNPAAHGSGVADGLEGLYALNDTVVIRFSRIDKGVFEFMEKKDIQQATAGNPFATPTNIPNNITGGALGIWAGYSPTFDTLICVP
ncbi:MAG: DUF4249 domain-containing protein [Fluviicola sp.]|nr:DUF4249 domain-containing protein [Fluviicola sp.]